MTDGEFTFAFVDLAGFTALTDAHGDDEAADLAGRFAQLATEALAETDRLVKIVGDEVMLVSPDPRAALALTGRLLDSIAAEPKFPLPRAGLHHGPAAQRGEDFFGGAVNRAARVAAQAFGGQVLGTRPIADAAVELGLTVVDLGSFSLHNVSEELELFDIRVRPGVTGGAVDPVCRMWVERDDAAGRLRFASVDYWFCSLGCAARFAEDPASFSA